MRPCTSTHDLIYAVVRRIPRGRVATYGQVASLAGLPRHARLVGYALHALPDRSDVPWHRVVNAQGRTSPRSDGMGHDQLQRLMLRREGVRFSLQGVLSLDRYRWRPRVTEGTPGAWRRSQEKTP
ncbi:MAG: MGMT family protein [Thermoanaerobaculia bacterium]